MSATDLLQDMIPDSQTLRSALGLRYPGFIHVTLQDSLASILAEGIKPYKDAAAPSEVTSVHGIDAGKIICLTPLGTRRVAPPVKEGKKACLAFFNEHLPQRVGLDWSFGPYMHNLVAVKRQADPNKPIGTVYLECINENGTFVSYDPIPAEHLRLFVLGVPPHDIDSWPPLSTESIKNAYTY